MSESAPTYIRCASGNKTFLDCEIARVGDLIRVLGYTPMEFTAEDAKHFAYTLLDLLDNPYRAVTPLAAIPEGANLSGDAIVDETIAMLFSRSRLGQEKYGKTLMRDDLSLLDWMRHAIEEGLDRTLYMIRALKDLEKLYDDDR